MRLVETLIAAGADPNSALVHDRRALVLLAQGRSNEAIGAQLRSLEIDPLSFSLQHHGDKVWFRNLKIREM